jgi:hypothetical protein
MDENAQVRMPKYCNGKHISVAPTLLYVILKLSTSVYNVRGLPTFGKKHLSKSHTANGGAITLFAISYCQLTTALINSQRKLAQIVSVQSFVRLGCFFERIGVRDVNFKLS